MDDQPPALQFDRAEDVAGAQPRSCASCHGAISDEYYSIGDKLLCGRCAVAIRAQLDRPGNFWNALGRGLLAAVLGAAVWYGVSKLTGYNIGLIAVAVGYFVGKGVAQGAGLRGGRRWQALAIALTYLAIMLTYAPEVWSWAQEHAHGALSYVFVFGLLAAMPVVTVTHAPLSAVINGFALWEAFKLTRPRPIPISGPHRVGAPVAPLPHV